MALGNNIIVAVGNSGTILTSPDGLSWTVRTSPTSEDLKGIIYGNNTFVAVGNSGTILTSADSISWTQRSSPDSGTDFTSIAYGSNVFVIAEKFSNGFLTSSDGITWTHYYLPGYSSFLDITSVSFSRVTYSNNVFFAMGMENCSGWCFNTGGASPLVYSSPDGKVWTMVDSSQYPFLAGDGHGVVYGNGVYLKFSDYSQYVLSSSDSVTWTQVTLPQPKSDFLRGIFFLKGIFIVVGDYGYMTTSSDGVNWSLVTTQPLQPIRKIVYGNGLWVAIGTNIIYTSTDGISWTPQYSTNDSTYDLTGITYGNNTFVAVGLYNAVLTSPDGKVWTKTMGTGLDDITFGKSTFVGVSGHNLLTASDGINWTVRASYPPIQYRGTKSSLITFGNGIFAAIGYDTESVPTNDVVYTSPDGISWTGYILDTPDSFKGLNDICYGNNTFLIVGKIGYVFSSSDGTNWVGRQSGAPTPGGGVSYNDRYGLAYGDGLFVSVGEWNTRADIQSSPDGITWTRRKSIASSVLDYVVYFNHTFMASSHWGAVIQSARDDTPDQFTFTDQTGVAVSTVFTSNTITISGIDPVSSISVTGGTYSINGGPYTSADGIVSNGDIVTVQLTSSGSYSTKMDTTLIIGGVFDTFSVTTQEISAQESLYGSFAGSGIWQWNGSDWNQLTPDNPEAIVASGTNLYGDFGSNGLWQFSGSGWSQLTPDNPATVVAAGANLYASFNGSGIWQWNGSGWSQLTPDNPAIMVAAGTNLYASFSGTGIWQWSDSGWTLLTPDGPEAMVASGTDLYGDFGSSGLWKWNGIGWNQLTPDNPEAMVASGTDLYGDFGGNGLWKWNGSGWSQLTPDNPEAMVSSGTNLYGDFGGNGLWQWNGSGWSLLTPDNPSIMVTGN